MRTPRSNSSCRPLRSTSGNPRNTPWTLLLEENGHNQAQAKIFIFLKNTPTISACDEKKISVRGEVVFRPLSSGHMSMPYGRNEHWSGNIESSTEGFI